MALNFEDFEVAYKRRFLEQISPVLTDAIKKQLETGQGQVWQYIADLVIKGVDRYVYAVYKPTRPFYKRRGKRGGLGDLRNVKIDIGNLQIDNGEVSASFVITNTTVAGITYGLDDEGTMRAIPGNGEMIEDQILGGTGYKFGLPTASSYEGSFLQPRNFYQVYEDLYDPDYAGKIILSSISDDIQRCKLKAIELAIKDIT